MCLIVSFFAARSTSYNFLKFARLNQCTNIFNVQTKTHCININIQNSRENYSGSMSVSDTFKTRNMYSFKFIFHCLQNLAKKYPSFFLILMKNVMILLETGNHFFYNKCFSFPDSYRYWERTCQSSVSNNIQSIPFITSYNQYLPAHLLTYSQKNIIDIHSCLCWCFHKQQAVLFCICLCLLKFETIYSTVICHILQCTPTKIFTSETLFIFTVYCSNSFTSK